MGRYCMGKLNELSRAHAMAHADYLGHDLKLSKTDGRPTGATGSSKYLVPMLEMPFTLNTLFVVQTTKTYSLSYSKIGPVGLYMVVAHSITNAKRWLVTGYPEAEPKGRDFLGLEGEDLVKFINGGDGGTSLLSNPRTYGVEPGGEWCSIS